MRRNLIRRIAALERTVAAMQSRIAAMQQRAPEPVSDELEPILAAVRREYAVTADELVARCREQHLVRARQTAILLCYELRPQVHRLAQRFRRGRAAISYAVQAARDRLTCDHKYRAEVSRVRAQTSSASANASEPKSHDTGSARAATYSCAMAS